MKILFENKQLNEGPGAGYTISGTLTNVKINNVKSIEPAGKDNYGTYYEVELDATADFDDVKAESYYYGGNIDSTPVSIIRARINSDNEPTTEEVKDAIEDAKIKVTIGGGWSHSTFDGFIEGDLNKSPSSIDTYESVLDGILFELTDEKAVEYLDRAVQGDEEEDIDESSKESVAKTLTEDFNEDERIQALAKYLDIDPSEISNIYDYEFETPEGDYLVVDEDEARQLAEDNIENFIDEFGIEGFTEDFKQWIENNALDTDWFIDAVTESMEAYADDIENESSSDDRFENRLEEEMYDEDIIDDDDLENGYDFDSSRFDFINRLVNNAGDPIDYCRDNFGSDWISQAAKQNNLYDIDEIVDEAINWDGVAHFIAVYDGNEIELGNGLFAYRTN